MTVIRMIVTMTGDRYDGQPWPPFSGLIDVPDWEAVQLTDNRIAEYLGEPEFADGGVVSAGDSEYSDDVPLIFDNSSVVPPGTVNEDDFDRDDEVTAEVKKPYTNASKADWIHYAISQGERKDTAVSMTKAALIEKYN